MNLRATSMGEVYRRVGELAGAVRSRAAEIEANGTVPKDLLDDLVATGVFDAMRPVELGGSAPTVVEMVDVLRILARADGAVGWITNIGSDNVVFAAGLTRSAYERIFSAPGTVLIGGGANFAGNYARPVEGGYVVNGRWRFVSGVRHDTWLMGFCCELPPGVDPPGPSGERLPIRVVYTQMPRDGVEILDTWDVVGLRGTGSNDVAFTEVFVPAELSFAFPGTLWPHDKLYRIPHTGGAVLRMAAVSVGIAEGALDDLVQLAGHKRSAMSDGSTKAFDSPMYRYELGRAEAALRGACDALRSEAVRIYDDDGVTQPQVLDARARATAAWVVDRCADVVTQLYRLGGGSALYATSPLQRRMRDINVATQHIAMRPEAFVEWGATMVGAEAASTMLPPSREPEAARA